MVMIVTIGLVISRVCIATNQSLDSESHRTCAVARLKHAETG